MITDPTGLVGWWDILPDAFGAAFIPSGDAEVVGSVAGTAVGVFWGVPGAFLGSQVGGWIGSLFDPKLEGFEDFKLWQIQQINEGTLEMHWTESEIKQWKDVYDSKCW